MRHRQVRASVKASPDVNRLQGISVSAFQGAPQDFKIFGNLGILKL